MWNAEAVAQSLQCQNHVSTDGDWLSPQKLSEDKWNSSQLPVVSRFKKWLHGPPWYCCVIWKVDYYLLMKVESNMQLRFVALPRIFYSWHHVIIWLGLKPPYIWYVGYSFAQRKAVSNLAVSKKQHVSLSHPVNAVWTSASCPDSLRYSICRSSDTCQETQWGKVFLWTVKCLRGHGSHEEIIR